jgi:hypothetical protein
MMHYIERGPFGRSGLRQRLLWIYEWPRDGTDDRQSGCNFVSRSFSAPPSGQHTGMARNGSME